MWSRPTRYVLGSTLAAALIGVGAMNVLAQPEDDRPARPGQGKGQHDGQGRGQGKDRGDGERGSHRGGPMMMLFRGIDLTQEQRDQLRTLHEETREKNEAWRKEHQAELDAIRAEIEAAHKKMRDLLASSPASPQSTRDDVLDILTDEQDAQYEENLKRFEQMKEQGPPMGPPGEGRGPGEFRDRPDGDGERDRDRDRRRDRDRDHDDEKPDA